jgi:hypothetical protein
MLFRRVAEHVLAQNWTAVWIDFVIVVFGVFMGIQVSNWNTERAERSLEAVYTKRLYQEVIELEKVRAEILADRKRASVELQYAINKLTGRMNGALTPAECFWLVDNPKVTNPTDELPLVMELLSSGRLTIFTDKTLEMALGNFLITRSRARDSGAGITVNLPQLDMTYSELFAIRGALTPFLPKNEEELDQFFQRAPITCDEDAMRQNQLFINDLALFELIFSYHIRDNTNVSESLSQLRAALDEILEHTDRVVAQ